MTEPKRFPNVVRFLTDLAADLEIDPASPDLRRFMKHATELALDGLDPESAERILRREFAPNTR